MSFRFWSVSSGYDSKYLIPLCSVFSLAILIWSFFCCSQAIAKSDDDLVYLDALRAVEQRLKQWAKAWSDGDVERYLSFYSPKYAPAGMRREKWIKQRKQRINRQRQINVELDIREVFMDGMDNMATTVFVQSYQSRNYRDRVLKKLVWRHFQGQWLIISEQIYH